MKSFTQKLNRLRTLYFLSTAARADFSFKVILSSVAYTIVWVPVGRYFFFRELKKILVQDAKIIHGLDWHTPSEEVLACMRKPLKSLHEQKLPAFKVK